jgi:hypothetical protein
MLKDGAAFERFVAAAVQVPRPWPFPHLPPETWAALPPNVREAIEGMALAALKFWREQEAQR